jgi:hypothetical protein
VDCIVLLVCETHPPASPLAVGDANERSDDGDPA